MNDSGAIKFYEIIGDSIQPTLNPSWLDGKPAYMRPWKKK